MWSVQARGAGADLTALVAPLKAAEGVLSVAAFGQSVHVAGRDPAQLQAAIAPWRQHADLHWAPAEPDLEDVFINLEERLHTVGTAIYRDRYRREDGAWRIARTEYDRVMEIVSPIDPDAVDSSAEAVGVLAFGVDATTGDRDDALLIARHAIVASHALVWPAGITPAQKATAIAQLTARGVLVRTSA